MRILSLIAALLLLAVFSLSCGGRSSQGGLNAHPSTPIQLTPTQLGALPELPTGGQFSLQRISSTATASLIGIAAVETKDTSVAGTGLELDSQPGQVSYAVYEFVAAPGEPVEKFSFDGMGGNPNSKIFAGISNYTAGRWEFFAPQTTATTYTLDTTPGKYVSPTGHIYIIAATFDNNFYTVNQVKLDFSTRFTVSGKVVDGNNTPIAGAVVGTPLGLQATVTDASGNYSLALPSGSWPVVVTDDTWTFYSNPQVATVTTANVTNIDFHGRQQHSHFIANELEAYNNLLTSPQTIDLSQGPWYSTISALDDRSDFYLISVAAAGEYNIDFKNPDLDVYFPYMSLWTKDGSNLTATSSVLRGTTRLHFLAGGPRQFILDVAASGGGGNYSIELSQGDAVELSGHVSVGGLEGVPGATVTAHNDVTGEDTEYMTSIGGPGGGLWMDTFRAPVSTTVSVALDGATFAPPTDTFDLSLGAVTNADFATTFLVVGDSMEPNDTQLSADTNAAVSTSYDSVTAGDDLSVGGPDTVDYYKISPASGKGLRVRVNLATDSQNYPLSLALLDSSFNYASANFGFDATGEEVRLSDPTNGNPYYLSVQTPGDSRLFQYSISVEEYDPFVLNFSASFGASPLGNAKIQLRNDAGLSFGSVTTDPTLGTAPGLLCKDGEVILSEFFRYGVNIDRSTQETVINGAAVTVAYNADPALSMDSHENNDSVFNPGPPLTLPASLQATVDPDYDFLDHYKFTTSTGDPIKVTVNSNEAARFYVELFDSTNNYLGGSYANVGTDLFLATTGAGDYTVRVSQPGGPAQYTLDIDTGAAYHLKGSVLYNSNPISQAIVYCTELDKAMYVDGITGLYDFGVLAAGTYTLSVYRAGYTPDQASQQGVITNADATVNFTLSINGSADSNEPTDDTKAGASGPLTSGVETSFHTVGDGADSSDWYKFTAQAGQLVDVQVDWLKSYYPNLSFDVQDSVGNYIGGAFVFNTDQAYCTFKAPANDTYFIHVVGGATSYKVKATVN
jgi:hypothetical protein